MKNSVAVTAVLVLLCLGSLAQANITIPMVPVGDPGNAGELSAGGGVVPARICGSVSYSYNIGKYEVTAGQYAEFLNKVAKIEDTYGLYHPSMWTNDDGCKIQQNGDSGNYTYSVASDYASRPVGCVSYWDACRFANWLHNGQPTGLQDARTTEHGAYTLDGYDEFYGGGIERNANWRWAVTSEDEWYKAAYYKGGGTSAGYWDYPTKSDDAPGRDMNDVAGNNANYYGTPFPIESGKYTTSVGEFENSASAYGTFDQGGNVVEYNETEIPLGGTNFGRVLRGGSLRFGSDRLRASSPLWDTSGNADDCQIGFRIVQAVPEPASLLALGGGLLALGGLIRRRR